ncbi:hypothetical protein DAEQUDRAFT_463245 [Daedalea quercina L-15889]|uniref:Uncharacterized protein n=1 Tax=Daedalea quercina L-15889 TaxID=1314783 RepID=A0A165TE86_9APHY|nr:hypothetical protein DAEQUDRAFT_463245 [Daedalea quercina L-15889]
MYVLEGRNAGVFCRRQHALRLGRPEKADRSEIMPTAAQLLRTMRCGADAGRHNSRAYVIRADGSRKASELAGRPVGRAALAYGRARRGCDDTQMAARLRLAESDNWRGKRAARRGVNVYYHQLYRGITTRQAEGAASITRAGGRRGTAALPGHARRAWSWPTKERRRALPVSLCGQRTRGARARGAGTYVDGTRTRGASS